jgi:AraC family transcriptional regulator
MKVELVTFPETKVAVITHVGPPCDEHLTALKLISWKIEKGYLDPDRYRSYGLHYPDTGPPQEARHRVDFCLSIEEDVGPNPYGIVQAVIPCLRCACARDIGSRSNNKAAAYLLNEWLPASGEKLSGHPLIFHYVNVGPNVAEREAITDVYVPIV